MKKLAAILLLTVLSFNLIGYKFLFDYLQHKNDIQLQKAFDNQIYNDKDLITLKIPLSMPYQTENSEFERVDGEITIDGIVYKYVKRKIEQGQLILLCLLDQKKAQLLSGKDEFFKLANDFEHYSPSRQHSTKSTTIFKQVVYEYKEQLILNLVTCQVETTKYIIKDDHWSQVLFHSTPERPPNFIAA